jgi:hypothetical protein
MIKFTWRCNSINILVIFFLFITGENVKSQKIEINPVFGYGTASNFPRDQDYLSIGGGVEYGISLNHSIWRTWRLEISYKYLKSDISTAGPHVDRTAYCDLTSNYFSIGAMKEFNRGQRLNPYLLAAGGLVNYHPLSGSYSNENLLHLSLAGGLKFSVTDFIGLRLQAGLIAPVWFHREYFSTGYSQIIASFKTTKIGVQADFTIGVILIIPDSVESTAKQKKD